MTVAERLTDQYLKHIDSIIAIYENANRNERDLLDDGTSYGLIARIQDTVKKVVGEQSPYYVKVDEVVNSDWHYSYIVDVLIGVIKSLRDALTDGFLVESGRLLRREVFSDFLSMSQHLLEEGYKDPAAIMAGSTLEAHLRQLCVNHGISETTVNARGATKPKTASRLNDDLYKAGIYRGTDHKNITAWLSIRNSAAHGHYNEYTDKEVDLLIAGIRNFIERYSR